MSPSDSTVLRATLAALLAFGATVPAIAQVTNPDTPASSPLWWTLTDDISPSQLKAIHADTKGHRERFKEALAAGLTTEGYPGEARDVRFFIGGAASPELIPFWFAFDGYSSSAAVVTDWDRVMTREMARFGITEQTAARINAITTGYFEDVDTALVTAKSDSEAFWGILEVARQRIGEDDVQAKLKAHDHVGLALAGGAELARMKHLMDRFYSSPRAAVAVPRLEELRATLDEEEWTRFRRYLLSSVAPGTTVKLRNSDL